VLIAIEGVDGAGKRTLSEALRKAFEAAGMSVATLAFPRYGQSVTADIAAEALHGEHGDLASSAYAMAMLFALDRAGAVGEIEELGRDHDVVILDRYVASNAAYSAARLHEDSAGPAVAWVHRLEYERLRLPAPDWQVLLAVSAELAGRRGVHRTGRRGLGWTMAGRRRGRRSGCLGGHFDGPIGPSWPEFDPNRPYQPRNTRVVPEFYPDLVTPWTP
jgi:dTMP kinase